MRQAIEAWIAFAVILLGGLRELIATTVEDGGEIGDITEVAVHATVAMLGPDQESKITTHRSLSGCVQ